MPDPRLLQYADLLTTRCLQVRPGDQVLLQCGAPGLPLVEEVARLVARAGAHPIPLISTQEITRAIIEESPEETLAQVPEILHRAMMTCDAWLLVNAPENTRGLSSLDPRRVAVRSRAAKAGVTRRTNLEVRWVLCNYPTQALAQEAAMSLGEYADFVYGACLVDWGQAAGLMRQVAAAFDAGSEVRLVGPGTDLTLNLAGRPGKVDDGIVNMPGGEVFYSPVEDATEGHVTFDYPAIYAGRAVEGIRLRFQAGRVVDASATSGEAFLVQMLDTDAGARVLGEFGIGCNFAIDRFTGDILFDEKIGGSVHLAVGRGFPWLGGQNESALHWDMIKDLRRGGQIWLDGRLVQENGQFRI